MDNAEFEKRGDMVAGRYGCGIVHIGQKIFVFGGQYDLNGNVRTSECYNMPCNKWTPLTTCSIPDPFTYGISVIAVHQRYIFGFGGSNNLRQGAGKDDGTMRIMRLDILKLERGWRQIYVQSPGKENCFYQGVFPCGRKDDDTYELLIFGGVVCPLSETSERTAIFRTSLSDFEQSQIIP